MNMPRKTILGAMLVACACGLGIPAYAIDLYQNFSTDRYRTVADVNGDGVPDILELFEEQVHVYRITDHAPECLPGWPQDVDSTQVSINTFVKNLPPAVGDVLPQHPGIEVVCLTYFKDPPAGIPVTDEMALHVFAPDGALLATEVFDRYVPYSLVLADLDEDGDLEIIVGGHWRGSPSSNSVLALQGDGSLFSPVWPVPLEYTYSALLRTISIAVGDVDGNGDLEIVYGAVINPPGVGQPIPSSIFVLNADGTSLTGWEGGISIPEDEGGIQRPVLADLDHDNTLEIIISTRSVSDSYLHIYRSDGQEYSPRQYLGYLAYPPLVGDLNGDGWSEIVVCDWGLDDIYVFDYEGQIVRGFSGAGGEMVLADVDGDGIVEIITGSSVSTSPADSRINAIRYTDASQPPGWPIYPGSFVGSDYSVQNWVPTAANLDDDEQLEVLLGNTLLEIPVVCPPDKLQWPMFQHDRCHTARHGAIMAVPGDLDGDGDVDADDFAGFVACVTGPAGGPIDSTCRIVDFDADDDVDLKDFMVFTVTFAGEQRTVAGG